LLTIALAVSIVLGLSIRPEASKNVPNAPKTINVIFTGDAMGNPVPCG